MIEDLAHKAGFTRVNLGIFAGKAGKQTLFFSNELEGKGVKLNESVRLLLPGEPPCGA